jgi:hypothetical protein
MKGDGGIEGDFSGRREMDFDPAHSIRAVGPEAGLCSPGLDIALDPPIRPLARVENPSEESLPSANTAADAAGYPSRILRKIVTQYCVSLGNRTC